MNFLPPALCGPAWMIATTATYVANDAIMKLVLTGLPPMEALAIRGVFGIVFCLPIIIVLGYGRDLGKLFNPWVVLRSLCEVAAVMCFMTALARMPLADLTALSQMTPLFLLLGTATILRERIGSRKLALVGVGFAGALMVAQPGGDGSPYALLVVANSIFAASRDITGRKVPADVPAWIVTLASLLSVLVGAIIVSAATEQWVPPEAGQYGMLLLAAVLLTTGHFCIFTAYRVGIVSSVAPFQYMSSVWAVLLGVALFGHFPNTLAACGIVFILVSGVSIVLLDNRKRRLLAAA
jgi:drug/metabolite transporter (DMT)-like permease